MSETFGTERCPGKDVEKTGLVTTISSGYRIVSTSCDGKELSLESSFVRLIYHRLSKAEAVP